MFGRTFTLLSVFMWLLCLFVLWAAYTPTQIGHAGGFVCGLDCPLTLRFSVSPHAWWREDEKSREGERGLSFLIFWFSFLCPLA